MINLKLLKYKIIFKLYIKIYEKQKLKKKKIEIVFLNTCIIVLQL